MFINFHRYIPENFYSDFTISEQGKIPDYLETVVAGKGITTTVSASQLQPNAALPAGAAAAGQTVIQQPSGQVLPIGSMSTASPQLITSPITTSAVTAPCSVAAAAAPGQPQQPQQLTIQLPTQPQPIQGVKTVTYVNPVINKPTQIQTSPAGVAPATSLQPVKLTTPTFAYTSSGKQ